MAPSPDDRRRSLSAEEFGLGPWRSHEREPRTSTGVEVQRRPPRLSCLGSATPPRVLSPRLCSAHPDATRLARLTRCGGSSRLCAPRGNGLMGAPLTPLARLVPWESTEIDHRLAAHVPPDHSAVELAESDSVARTAPRVRSATSRDGNAANEPRTAVMRMCMQSKGGGQQGSRGVRRGAWGAPTLLGTGPRDSGPTATIACVGPATGDGGWPPPACGPGRGRCRPLWRRPSVASSPPRQRPCRRPRPSPAPSVCTRGGPEHSAAIHPSPFWPSGSRSRPAPTTRSQ